MPTCQHGPPAAAATLVRTDQDSGMALVKSKDGRTKWLTVRYALHASCVPYAAMQIIIMVVGGDRGRRLLWGKVFYTELIASA